jgi:hypothetical protein
MVLIGCSSRGEETGVRERWEMSMMDDMALRRTVEQEDEVGRDFSWKLGVVLDRLESDLVAEQPQVQHRGVGEQLEGAWRAISADS